MTPIGTLFFAVLMHAVLGQSTTATFVGKVGLSSALWSDPTNWDPQAVPGPMDHVLLLRSNCTTGGSTLPDRATSVFLDTNATVASVTVYGFIPPGYENGCSITLILDGTVLETDTLTVLPTGKVLLKKNSSSVQARSASFGARSYLSGTGELRASERILFQKDAVVYPGSFETRCPDCAPGMVGQKYGDIVLRSPSIQLVSAYFGFQQIPSPWNGMPDRYFPELPYSHIVVDGLLTNTQSFIVLVNATCRDDAFFGLTCRDSSWPAMADIMTWTQPPTGDPLLVTEAESKGAHKAHRRHSPFWYPRVTTRNQLLQSRSQRQDLRRRPRLQQRAHGPLGCFRLPSEYLLRWSLEWVLPLECSCIIARQRRRTP